MVSSPVACPRPPWHKAPITFSTKIHPSRSDCWFLNKNLPKHEMDPSTNSKEHLFLCYPTIPALCVPTNAMHQFVI